jgi:transposase
MEEKKTAQILRRRDTAGKRTLEIHRLGPHPIIQHFLEHLAVARILDKHIHSNRDGVLSHGTAITVLVHNVLLSRDPLYRLAEWIEGIEPRALGLNAEEKLAINDDRMGRALEQLAEFGGRGVFFQLALRAIKLFRIETRRIHFDTTSVTFCGEYAGSTREPRITNGHNKDHRPDLKQLVFGLNVTSDGAVPVSHGVWSGNQNDDTLHRGNFDALRDLLQKDDFIYVADCKLASKENLRHIDSFGGLFATVMPRTRKEDSIFRAALRRKAARWKLILTADNEGAEGARERYWWTTEGGARSEDGFRLLWIKSSAKADEDRRSREAKLTKAKAELEELRGRLNRRELKAGAKIRQAIRKILKGCGCEDFLDVKLSSEVRTRTKRLRPGRPGKGDSFQYVSDTLYDFEVKERAVALRREANTDGVFPLLTNLPEERYKTLEVLQIYRYQPYIERRFENLKTEYAIAPVYLKKSKRVVGLLHVYFIAIMVAALIERQIRGNMVKGGIAALPIYPEERECRAPTSPRLFGTFSNVDWFKEIGPHGEAVFPVKLTKTQHEVLKLLGLSQQLYESYPME